MYKEKIVYTNKENQTSIKNHAMNTNTYENKEIYSVPLQYSIVIPLYNEENVIYICWNTVNKIMQKLSEKFEIILVNDGSIDKTQVIAEELCRKNSNTKLINFSRNFGHQAAISAGIQYASGKAIVIIDADLQDPPELIPEMIKKWKDGYHVVYAKRKKRKGEGFFKKITALFFYRFLNNLTDINIPLNTGDFRLIDSRIKNELNLLPEKSRYVRGLITWLGFKQTYISYIREKRYAGKSKYPITKILKFAVDGITAFSYKPLRLATISGIFLSFLSFAYLIFIIYQRFFTTTTIKGWSSIIVINLFFNGFILIILGILGEYVGRIYEEVKMRPLYIIQNTIGFEKIALNSYKK